MSHKYFQVKIILWFSVVNFFSYLGILYLSEKINVLKKREKKTYDSMFESLEALIGQSVTSLRDLPSHLNHKRDKLLKTNFYRPYLHQIDSVFDSSSATVTIGSYL